MLQQLGFEPRALFGVHQPVQRVEPVHRVVAVDDGAHSYEGAILPRVKRSESAAPPTSSGTCDAGLLQVAGRDHHLLRRLHEQPGKADGVRPVLARRFDQHFRRHLDPQVHDLIAVVREDDVDQVLADVVDIALHRRQQDAPARRAVRSSP